MRAPTSPPCLTGKEATAERWGGDRQPSANALGAGDRETCSDEQALPRALYPAFRLHPLIYLR